MMDAQTLLQLVSGGMANLRANAETVDRLNVFPIPDGDTGANMLRTLSGGVSAAAGYTGTSVGEAAGKLADGMLLSARGNSGVILSQLFEGFAKGLEGLEDADMKQIIAALDLGVQAAYSAVATPTEGTILTVAREALENARQEREPEAFRKAYLAALEVSLRHTPELLPVLKEAGVIDSGGAGLYYIVRGADAVRRGAPIAEAPEVNAVPEPAEIQGDFDENSTMEFGYCTEFLLQLLHSKCDLDAFRVEDLIEWLSGIGDSIVAFRTGSIVKVHVHTMTPGAVLAHCQQYGEFRTLKIENMTLQHHETVTRNDFPEAEKKPFAVVTVANGAGLQQAFRELGADAVIDGGQTANPSTQDFLDAFRQVHAGTIFVLPNNGNILLAAKQAAGMYEDSDVRIIESHSTGQGYAALSMLCYDSGDADEIAQSLTEAMEGVSTGQVTRSVRDAVCSGIPVRQGDFIGFCGDTMEASHPEFLPTAMELAEKMGAGDHEIALLIWGKDCSPSARQDLKAALRRGYPAMEQYDMEGGQAVYDLTLVLE